MQEESVGQQSLIGVIEPGFDLIDLQLQRGVIHPGLVLQHVHVPLKLLHVGLVLGLGVLEAHNLLFQFGYLDMVAVGNLSDEDCSENQHQSNQSQQAQLHFLSQHRQLRRLPLLHKDPTESHLLLRCFFISFNRLHTVRCRHVQAVLHAVALVTKLCEL